jgi:hypothetical protein
LDRSISDNIFFIVFLIKFKNNIANIRLIFLNKI